MEKRDKAEKRVQEAENRVASTEEGRKVAESRVKEFEENFRKMEMLNEEKAEVAAKSVDIAKREAQEAKTLMRYFESRMEDSEKKLPAVFRKSFQSRRNRSSERS